MPQAPTLKTAGLTVVLIVLATFAVGHMLDGIGPTSQSSKASSGMHAEAVVREFWRLMATNDFQSVKAVLADDLVVEWPQSRERIRGPENFARVNAEYPAQGRWRFRINEIVVGRDRVVTQVSVTDGVLMAEPVSFFTVVDGKIARMLDYWPERFPPASNRRHLVESMD